MSSLTTFGATARDSPASAMYELLSIPAGSSFESRRRPSGLEHGPFSRSPNGKPGTVQPARVTGAILTTAGLNKMRLHG